MLDDDERLVCPRCDTVRPPVCLVCGDGRFANLRPGVTRLREELEAAAGRPVVEVTGGGPERPPEAGVYVGTEAVLHRVGRADTVAFLDLDRELLAPRYRAAEQAMALIVRAARLVGPRSRGGRLLLQTFLPHHDVVQAALLADPGRIVEREREQRRMLGLPPYGALAEISGDGERRVRRLDPAGGRGGGRRWRRGVRGSRRRLDDARRGASTPASARRTADSGSPSTRPDDGAGRRNRVGSDVQSARSPDEQHQHAAEGGGDDGPREQHRAARPGHRQAAGRLRRGGAGARLVARGGGCRRHGGGGGRTRRQGRGGRRRGGRVDAAVTQSTTPERLHVVVVPGGNSNPGSATAVTLIAQVLPSPAGGVTTVTV